MKNTKVKDKRYNTCSFGRNHCGITHFSGNNTYLFDG